MKELLKRILSSAISVLLFASVFTSCNQSTETSSELEETPTEESSLSSIAETESSIEISDESSEESSKKTVDFKEILDRVPTALPLENYCEVGYDGSYLKISTGKFSRMSDAERSILLQDIQTVNRYLYFSGSLYEKMENTRAIDGTQKDENDLVKVSWTYHPDNGLVILYEKK